MSIKYDTETLDKLYLEWSQFTTARTAREIRMMEEMEDLRRTNDDLSKRCEEYQKMFDAEPREEDR